MGPIAEAKDLADDYMESLVKDMEELEGSSWSLKRLTNGKNYYLLDTSKRTLLVFRTLFDLQGWVEENLT